MAKIYHGIDISSVKRIESSIKQSKKRFLERVFTAKEVAYCSNKKRKYEHYAARFSAKEAVMKALEVSPEKSIDFKEIEVRRRATGKPYIYLSQATRKKMKLPKKAQFELSLSHDKDYAIASVYILL